MGVLRPKQPFVTVDKKGRKHRFGLDTLVDAKDPIVKGREDLFESVDVVAERKPVTAHGPRVFDDTEIAAAQVKRGRRNNPRRGQKPRQAAGAQAPAETPASDELTGEQREALEALSDEQLAALAELSDEDREVLAALTDDERAALAELAAAETPEA